MTRLTLTQPDDWHIHLRDGQALEHTVRDASRYMKRVIVMPNLVPPVTKAEHARAYHQRIMAHAPADFQPLMVLYLTESTCAQDIYDAKADGLVVAAKLYPAGATTNSDSGVRNVQKIYPVLQAMQETGMLLLIHGEVTDSDIDIFDREAAFIERTLIQLVKDFPNLKIVLEHITTSQAAEFVANAGPNVAATITAHHLLYNRNHMLAGGIRPHYYCLPILKRNTHQQALLAAATSDSGKFFLGTDSAPHAQHAKESSCGCAGSYTAHAALELYARAFASVGQLDKLEAFASFYGPDFYGLPRNSAKIELVQEKWTVPSHYPMGENRVVPILAGEELEWTVNRLDNGQLSTSS